MTEITKHYTGIAKTVYEWYESLNMPELEQMSKEEEKKLWSKV